MKVVKDYNLLDSTPSVWVITGRSESGDDYGPFVFNEKPSDKVLKNLVQSKCDYDKSDPDGPGDYGSYTYLTITRCEILKVGETHDCRR